MNKKPTKKQLSEAGKALRNPHTREAKENQAAKILRAGRKTNTIKGTAHLPIVSKRKNE